MKTKSPAASRRYAKKKTAKAPAKKYYRRTKRVYSRVPRMLRALPVNQCEKGYLAAVTMPFSASADGACVPHFPSRPSMKTAARYQGIITCAADSSAGAINPQGFVAVAPCLANDLPCIYYSTGGAFTGNMVDVSQTGAISPVQLVQGNPYSYRDLIPRPVSGQSETNVNLTISPEIKGRIVSAGLRIRYIGPENTAAGIMCVFTTASHENIQRMNFDDMQSRVGCRRVPVSREWTQIVDSASDAGELDYGEPPILSMGSANIQNFQYIKYACYPYCNDKTVTYASADYGDQGAITMIAFIVGASAGAKYEFEYIQHNEFVGEKVVNATVNQTIAGSTDRVQAAKDTTVGSNQAREDNTVSCLLNYAQICGQNSADPAAATISGLQTGQQILKEGSATIDATSEFMTKGEALKNQVIKYTGGLVGFLGALFPRLRGHRGHGIDKPYY